MKYTNILGVDVGGSGIKGAIVDTKKGVDQVNLPDPTVAVQTELIENLLPQQENVSKHEEVIENKKIIKQVAAESQKVTQVVEPILDVQDEKELIIIPPPKINKKKEDFDYFTFTIKGNKEQMDSESIIDISRKENKDGEVFIVKVKENSFSNNTTTKSEQNNHKYEDVTYYNKDKANISDNNSSKSSSFYSNKDSNKYEIPYINKTNYHTRESKDTTRDFYSKQDNKQALQSKHDDLVEPKIYEKVQYRKEPINQVIGSFSPVSQTYPQSNYPIYSPSPNMQEISSIPTFQQNRFLPLNDIIVKQHPIITSPVLPTVIQQQPIQISNNQVHNQEIDIDSIYNIIMKEQLNDINYYRSKYNIILTINSQRFFK